MCVPRVRESPLQNLIETARAAPADAVSEVFHLEMHIRTGSPAYLATVKTASPYSCVFKCELSAGN